MPTVSALTTWTPTAEGNDGSSIEVGVRFRVLVDGVIRAVRFYRRAGDTAAHTVHLYSTLTRDLIASATGSTSDGTAGWEEIEFSSPVPVYAFGEYTATTYSPSGDYVVESGGFDARVVNGPLELHSDLDTILQYLGIDHWEPLGNGAFVFNSPDGTFPVETPTGSPNYGVDVVFEYDGPRHSYASVLPDQVEQREDLPDALFSDEGQLTLATKFRTAQSDVVVRGIRHFVGDAFSGPLVATIWSETGTKLAEKTSASFGAGAGWREILFDSPVTLSPNTIYVASVYHANASYGATPQAFSGTAITDGVIEFPASGDIGGNGVFATGAGPIFPTETLNDTLYWVDLLYDTAPVVEIDGEGAFSLTGTADLAEVAAPFISITGEGGYDFSGEAILDEQASGVPDVVEITGEGAVGFLVTGAAVGVVEAQGQGGHDLSGTANLTEVVPGATFVSITGAGGYDLSGAGLLSAIDPDVISPPIAGPVTLAIDGAPIRLDDGVVDVAIKRGDTLPPIEGTVLDRDGEPVPLTGAALRVLIGQRGQAPIVDAAAVVTDGQAGRWRYDWRASDTDEAGRFALEIEATWPDGGRLTAPTAGYARLRVVDDLG